MSKNVYEILEIQATDNPKLVKKAYIRQALKFHPDKNLNNKEEAEAKFKEVANAYDLVKEEHQLKAYYQAYLNGTLDQFTSANRAHPRDATPSYQPPRAAPTQPSNALFVPKTGTIDIFIPLDLDNDLLTKLKPGTTPEKFAAEFNFNKLLAMLNELRGKFQVGVNYQEAIDITNLHKHHYYRVIVQVTVQLNDLSDSRLKESEMIPGMLNAKNNSDYFWFEPHTPFTLDDIISVAPMTFGQYQNTLAMGGPQIDACWPGNHVVMNPTNPGLIEGAKQIRNQGLIKQAQVPVQNQEQTRENRIAGLMSVPQLQQSSIAAIMPVLQQADNHQATPQNTQPLHQTSSTAQPKKLALSSVLTHYKYAESNRYHFYTVGRNNVKGDKYKAMLLDGFKRNLEYAQDLTQLDQIISKIKISDAYKKELALGTGIATRLFGLKTDSVKAFEKMCDEAKSCLQVNMASKK